MLINVTEYGLVGTLNLFVEGEASSSGACWWGELDGPSREKVVR